MYTFHVLLDVDGGNKDEHDDDIAFHFAKLCSDRREERWDARGREGVFVSSSQREPTWMTTSRSFVSECTEDGAYLPRDFALQ